jgi:hypothetical protein
MSIEANKQEMLKSFESWYGRSVGQNMHIKTTVALLNWETAWNAALNHARRTAEQISSTYAYTPAQKRALNALIQKL